MPPDRGRAVTWLLALSIIVAAVTACSGGDGGAALPGAVAGFRPSMERSLTSAQAESLALVRRRLGDEGTVAFDVELDVAGHQHGMLTIDWDQGIGYGRLQDDDAAAPVTIAWRDDRLFLFSDDLHLAGAGMADGPGRPMTTVYSDVFLTLLLRLGAPSGESPQLLQQSSARYLGDDTVNGVRCIVLTGPDSTGSGAASAATTSDRTRYWVAADGELQRFAARFGRGDDWAHATRSSDGTTPIPDEIIELVAHRDTPSED